MLYAIAFKRLLLGAALALGLLSTVQAGDLQPLRERRKILAGQNKGVGYRD